MLKIDGFFSAFGASGRKTLAWDDVALARTRVEFPTNGFRDYVHYKRFTVFQSF